MIALNIYKSVSVATVPLLQYPPSKFKSISFVEGLAASSVSLIDSSLSLTPKFNVLSLTDSLTPDFDVVLPSIFMLSSTGSPLLILT